MTPDANTLPLPFEPVGNGENPAMWMDTSQFQQLAEINERNAREALKNCFEGRTWRGFSLQVRMVESAGGRSGKAYQVYAPSLPPELYARFRDRHPALFSRVEVVNVPVPTNPGNLETLAKHVRMAKWKESLLLPALEFRKQSPGRAEWIKDIASRTHTRPDGKKQKFPVVSVRAMIHAYEERGLAGLMRKQRVEKKQHRWILCRTWDKACPLPEPAMREISASIHQYVKNLWGNGVPSRDKVEEMASTELLRLSWAAGWAEATLDACRVGRHVVEMHQDKRIVAIADRDAKRLADKYNPRIKRTRKGLKPGDVVVGDVHPVDTSVPRANGSEATPREIAWYDLATNDVFYTLVHLNPREGIKQADIARSFVEMCMAWGLPRHLYLDNGSEYKWEEMIQGFESLTALVRDFAQFSAEIVSEDDLAQMLGDTGEGSPGRSAIIRANPYNAPAKPVEGSFSAQEKVFSMLPGYIGGDRMNKRTHRVGKAPKPYPGSWEDFQRDFATAIDFYRHSPQRGSLQGNSPAQTRARFEAEGFRKVNAPLVVFLLALAETLTPMVTTSGIQVGGRWYEGDTLRPLVGRRATVLYPKWAPEVVILDRGPAFPGERFVAIFERVEFDFLDGEGARERGRRDGVFRRYIRSQRQEVEKVDLVVEMGRHVGTMKQTIECSTDCSTGKGPQVLEIGLASQVAALDAQLREGHNPNPPRRLGSGEYRHPKNGEVRSVISAGPAETPQPQPRLVNPADLLAGLPAEAPARRPVNVFDLNLPTEEPEQKKRADGIPLPPALGDSPARNGTNQ
jgi:hypothetical protein